MAAIERGDRVEAYWNLHKLCLSYRHPQGRVHHTEGLWLTNVTFAVQPAGRQRVLTERRKNVHAFIRGTLVKADNDITAPRGGGFVIVTYNPYRHGHFYRTDTNEPIYRAREVIAVGKTIYARP